LGSEIEADFGRERLAKAARDRADPAVADRG
jgi:hypothetical protein